MEGVATIRLKSSIAFSRKTPFTIQALRHVDAAGDVDALSGDGARRVAGEETYNAPVFSGVSSAPGGSGKRSLCSRRLSAWTLSVLCIVAFNRTNGRESLIQAEPLGEEGLAEAFLAH